MVRSTHNVLTKSIILNAVEQKNRKNIRDNRGDRCWHNKSSEG